MKIPLTRGMFALVFDEDFESLNRHKWCVAERKKKHGSSTFYAVRRSGGMTIQMHRELLGLIPGDKKVVDHISRDGLDNRRINLRVVTRTQNNANLKSNRGSSRFKGVSWDKAVGKWLVHIGKDGKRTHLGQYPTEEMAARAYDEAALEIFGEYALLNFGSDNPESEELARRRRDSRRNPRGGSSRFRGVLWYKSTSKWVAKIKKDRKTFYLGYFATEKEAARAYDEKALELFGEHANLNQPGEFDA